MIESDRRYRVVPGGVVQCSNDQNLLVEFVFFRAVRPVVLC